MPASGPSWSIGSATADRAADLEARLDQAAIREGASADGRYVWYVL